MLKENGVENDGRLRVSHGFTVHIPTERLCRPRLNSSTHAFAAPYIGPLFAP